MPEPVAVSGGIALPPAAAPPPGAPVEIGVRGLAGRTGRAAEPFQGRVEPSVGEGDLVVESDGLSAHSTTRAPRWLVAIYAILPVFALSYVVIYTTGPRCGQGGALRVSEKDGRVVRCDGTALGPQTTPNVSRGQVVYQSIANCAQCHLANGAGQDAGGVGRPLYDKGTLLEDFPDLASQVEFVKGGSAKFPIYGAKNRKAQGVMPSFGTQLSDFDLVSAVMYERQKLHGGLAEEDPSEALPPPFGTAVPGGEATTTETVTATATAAP